MDKYSLYAAQFLSFKEHFLPKGHSACTGCGVALAVRQVYKALDLPAAALEKAKWQIPWEQSMLVKDDSVSGGSHPALLSIPKENGAAGDVLNICFDNEAAERGLDGAALLKRLPAVAAASGYEYAATACPSHPFDLVEKIRTGWSHPGSAYVHILCPCPVGWKFDAQNTVRIGRMAVEARIFPLYEIVNGYYRITSDDPNPRPLKEYIKAQERFASWSAKKTDALQDAVTAAFNALRDRTQKGI
jgi:pyruvate ferredoxin oxidoreductase beta subunit